jgi:hypothetical protein
MIDQMRQGEDIEHYADKYEERQNVLREFHESGGSNPPNRFSEEDERENRKTAVQQKYIY